MKRIIILFLMVLFIGGCGKEKERKYINYQELSDICHYVAKTEWDINNPYCKTIGIFKKIGDRLLCDCEDCMEWIDPPRIEKEHSYSDSIGYCENKNMSKQVFSVILSEELLEELK